VALSAAIAANLSLTLFDADSLVRFKAAATAIGVHVKLNSGMNRLGAEPDEAIALATAVHQDPRLRLEGFWTHLASAEEDAVFTREQLRPVPRGAVSAGRGGGLGFPQSRRQLRRPAALPGSAAGPGPSGTDSLWRAPGS